MRLIFLVILLMVCGNAYATDYTQDPNCLGAWLFKEGTGTTVADSSSNGNTGDFLGVGEPVWSTEVPKSFAPGSVNYDGDDDYIDCGTDSSLRLQGDFSIVLFVNWDAYNGTYEAGLMDSDDEASNRNFRFCIADSKHVGHEGKLRFIYNIVGNDFVISDSTISFDTWTHVALTFNNTTDEYIFYIDGISAGDGNTDITPANKSQAFSLGYDSTSVNHAAIDGLESEVAVFDRVLSEAEINEIMNNGLTGKFHNLILKDVVIKNVILKPS